MSNHTIPTSIHTPRHDRPTFENESDAYKRKSKLTEPTACPECNAVFHQGRWQWIDIPSDANLQICPACQRIKDHFPAGYVTVSGPFFDMHFEEIRRLIQNHAEHERLEHPLKRIMSIEHQNSSMLVSTTDTHLARGIGEALRHAYQGKLKVEHVSGECLVRVYWTR